MGEFKLIAINTMNQTNNNNNKKKMSGGGGVSLLWPHQQEQIQQQQQEERTAMWSTVYNAIMTTVSYDNDDSDSESLPDLVAAFTAHPSPQEQQSQAPGGMRRCLSLVDADVYVVALDVVSPAKRRKLSSSSFEARSGSETQEGSSSSILSDSEEDGDASCPPVSMAHTEEYQVPMLDSPLSRQGRQKHLPSSADDDATSSHLLHTISSDCIMKVKKTAVQFEDVVSVKEIPSHRMYPQEVRKQLWSSLKEIQANAKRNEGEFRADGDNWQTSTEEDQFQVWKNNDDKYNDLLLHPYTFQQKQLEQQEEEHRRKFTMLNKRSSFRDLSSAAAKGVASPNNNDSNLTVLSMLRAGTIYMND